MNLQQALQFIHGTLRFGSKLGLERMRELMNRLNNPQQKLRIIHVAGTNGKGTTVSLIADMLSVAGYKVGKYVSPYVYDFAERISINGEMIDEATLSNLTQRVQDVCISMEIDGWEHPTEFEIVTAIGFLYFYEMNVDFVVLEVGLGGRFDATNVIDKPLLSVITSISLDHENILGDTVEKIAYEKCGIIKEGVPVVIYPLQDDSVVNVIQQNCTDKYAKCICPNIHDLTVLQKDIAGNQFVYKNQQYTEILRGEYQIYNAITALEAVFELERQGYIEISPSVCQKAIENCQMPARFEIISKSPSVIFDAGHNPDGIRQLSSLIDANIPSRRVIVFGVLQDKNYQYAIEQLAGRADVFICVTPDNPRALSAVDAMKEAEKYCHECYAAEYMEQAICKAFEVIENGTLLVCGSFYIMEQARREIYKYL